jgi:hypothetical protein
MLNEKRKTINVEMRCDRCGDRLVYQPPPPPDMAMPCPVVTIDVQPCNGCIMRMANATCQEMNPGWESLHWMSYQGSSLEIKKEASHA